MRTEQINIFKFDELSKKARRIAVSNEQNSEHREIFYDMDNHGSMLEESGFIDPVISYSGFCSQGDGACFEGCYEYKKGGVQAVKNYAGQDKDITTTSLPVVAYTTSKMDNDTAYALTKTYWQQKVKMIIAR